MGVKNFHEKSFWFQSNDNSHQVLLNSISTKKKEKKKENVQVFLYYLFNENLLHENLV